MTLDSGLPVRSRTRLSRPSPSTINANDLTMTVLGLLWSTTIGSVVAEPSNVSLYFCRLASSLSASMISFKLFSGGAR